MLFTPQLFKHEPPKVEGSIPHLLVKSLQQSPFVIHEGSQKQLPSMDNLPQRLSHDVLDAGPKMLFGGGRGEGGSVGGSIGGSCCAAGCAKEFTASKEAKGDLGVAARSETEVDLPKFIAVPVEEVDFKRDDCAIEEVEDER